MSVGWAAAAFALVTALACAAAEEIPILERRGQELNKAIMCPVCPGESIDQSQNPLAVQMRGIVAHQLAQGRSEEEIENFFVERYGPSVLLEPPSRGFTLLVWVVPPVALLAAVVVLLMALRLMRRPEVGADDLPAGRPELSDDEREDYFRRVEAALDQESGGRGEAT